MGLDIPVPSSSKEPEQQVVNPIAAPVIGTISDIVSRNPIKRLQSICGNFFKQVAPGGKD